MYKLVVLDIDGTISEKDNIVTDRVKETIWKLEKNGVPVCISTGRNRLHTTPVVEQLNLDCLFSTIDGIKTFHLKEEAPIFDNSIEESVLLKAFDIIKDEKAYIEIVRDYGYDKFPVRAKQFDYSKVFSYDDSKTATRYTDIEDMRQGVADANVFIIGADLLSRNEMEEKLIRELGDAISIRNGFWGDYLFVGPPIYGKSFGITQLCEYYHCNMDEVVAIGDEVNDIDMIRDAGLGIAMGNGTDKVKAVADKVTDTVQNDGAAIALEEIFGL